MQIKELQLKENERKGNPGINTPGVERFVLTTWPDCFYIKYYHKSTTEIYIIKHQ